MYKTWIIALVGAALVAAAVVWIVRDTRRSAPPEPASAPVVKKRPAATPIQPAALVKPGDCKPLPNGGLSCGACRDNSDCPDQSTCVVNRLSGRSECLRPSCKEDKDCSEGTVCRVVGRTPSDAPLFSCVPPGVRATAAACDPNDAADPSVSCGANLLCVQGGCAPSCEPPETDEPRVCPALHECVQTEAGWGCVPDCKITGCPGGKTCSFLSVENPISLCTYPDGPNCLGSKGGCPATTDCVVETNPRTERTTFRCYSRCGADGSCGEGSVCVAGKKTAQCRRGCTPGASTSCGPGERCVKAGGAKGAWFCSAT